MKLILFAFLILTFGATFATAQKSVANVQEYKITNLKVVPFDSYRGEFQDEIKASGEQPTFFNDFSISLMVVVEITAGKGEYNAKQSVQITATEGKKVKKTKTEPMPPVDENGKYYIPLWLDAGMCDTVKITAKMIGQKAASTMTRSFLFQCGE
ncbi:MAG TPA: hypothetical protein PKE69_03520 [Pyrinomonadaceae bacterium]|nr:hypothetical protein [Pyrinomonadaceae bacterium]